MVEILGIKISSLDEKEVMEKIAGFLESQNQYYAVTPNPEIILYALKDSEYKKILNEADLALADGFGLILAGKLKGLKLKRITGSDLTPKILHLAENRKEKILILNWKKGLSSSADISTALSNLYPSLEVLVLDVERSDFLKDEEQEQITTFAPTLVFSALGFPEQEQVIYHNLKSWPSVRFAIGVGGTFDFLTGKAKRAPRLFRTCGLEWLFRLIKRPRRIRRIYRAVVVFAVKLIKNN